ncbi:MAG: TetR family transcriptional regulator [Chloroflexota bacterium]|nr:TetR family transcriptional regulator [Chloroflexota bacterium]
MRGPTAQRERSLRADAQRNRDALVAVARAALSSNGGLLNLEAIARKAGVGIGTLYRHFPTREVLIEAVYAAELEDLTMSATTLLSTLPPDAALREWVARYAHFAATKRGIIDTLHAGMSAGRIPASTTRERITAAIEPILTAGARAGSLREDIDPGDVTALLLGVFLSTATNSTVTRTGRLLDLVLDALRPNVAAKSAPEI